MIDEVTNLKATPMQNSVKLTWGVSSTSYLTGFDVIVTVKGAVFARINGLSAAAREYIVKGLNLQEKYGFNVRADVEEGGKLVEAAPLAPSPPPPPIEPLPAQTGLIVGICGLTGGNNGGLNLAQAKSAMTLTHATRDRIDANSVLNERVTAGAAAGIKSLVIADDLSVQAVVALATAMKPLGLTDLEFGNEVYYSNGFNGSVYGTQYKAAHDALKGMGITLIANAFTGESWCQNVFTSAGIVPDAWSLHPYGEMNEKSMGDNSGWQIVPQFILDAKAGGYGAPLHITEVGQPIWTGADGRKAVTEAEQAADVAQYIHDSAAWGVTSFYYFAMTEYTEPGGGDDGGYGLYNHDLTPRPSAVALGTAVSALI